MDLRISDSFYYAKISEIRGKLTLVWAGERAALCSRELSDFSGKHG